jgi:predicted TIM-barrel fold metal-dependent hydrolase
MQMNRRTFLAGAAGMAGLDVQRTEIIPGVVPIIDTHIHLFDPTRPQGAPYTGPRGSGAPRPALPDRYRALAEPLGVVGAIAVEASPWIEDNQWVLEAVARDPIMVGTIGNLQPEKPEFAEYLDRHHKNPLFRGIRYGNLWSYDLVKQVENPVFVEG